jgi:hypothetical protein
VARQTDAVSAAHQRTGRDHAVDHLPHAGIVQRQRRGSAVAGCGSPGGADRRHDRVDPNVGGHRLASVDALERVRHASFGNALLPQVDRPGIGGVPGGGLVSRD